MTRTAHLLCLPLLAGTLLLGPAALAQAPETTIEGKKEAEAPALDATKEWPCVQRRVETLTVGQIWDGPSVEGLSGWFRDPKLVELIEALSSRRVPLEKAEAAIKSYAEGLPEGERDQKLTLLFAGLFDKVAGQRRTVMSGIVKYQKSQIERSKELERQTSELARLQDQAASNESAAKDLAAAEERFNWAQRIFQERQSNIPLACELPVLIEERLYAVTRSIRENMKS